ncbi:hypothetical protein E3N88_28221 [Mikania micrantha]|uniref:Uncharacterized protein n=1 Tax=Mikania micrantha TaxID=192012 RepID=A0A5N6N010_9ASTR|nr:hypothetical protein E3N88_28221 [Mikania micrantha]
MFNKRNNIFSTSKPPPEDVSETSSDEEDIQHPLVNPAVNMRVNPHVNLALVTHVNPPVNIPANFPSIAECDEEDNDVYWNWPFNNLFSDNQDQEEPIIEQRLGHEEEPEDEHAPNDLLVVYDDVDKETLNRWRNHDPWEDEHSHRTEVAELTNAYQ